MRKNVGFKIIPSEKKFLSWNFLICLLSLFSAIAACAPKTIILTRSRLLMGHVPVNVTLKIPPNGRNRALEITQEAYQVAADIEKKISEYQPESEISCLNQRAGKRGCSLSPETLQLLKIAVEVSEKTDHAFDIRFASLSKSGKKGKILFEAHNRARLENPDTRIGVGGIGKGFIVDQMIAFIQSKGITQALVDAGGDLKALGGPWKVAIQTPGGSSSEISSMMEIQGLAFSTSGNYEQEGHILDPRTGKKIQRMQSVTVISESHTLADALATAFYVLGEKESLPYLKKFPGIRVIWMDPDGKNRSYP